VIGTAPPTPGQIVQVRQRPFVVQDVLRNPLPSGSIGGNGDGSQHLVTLSSVEEDALGEELQVVWELEPGARVHEQLSLPAPTGFDAPDRLDAFLDAVRWGAISSADIGHLQAPFRSGIVIEDYQLDPVARAIRMPRANLLVADDVGLGKTIEAGLVAQELILRHRVRTILVVCPSALQIQWREQMRDKFGLDFRIVDSALMRDLRRTRGLHVNPWTHFPRLVTSIDFLKRERPLRLFREVLPAHGESAYPRRFDLLIVDEAHNVAPAGGGQYATDSQRTSAVRVLAPHFEHKLFLSATPHNGYAESFTALLEMLDDQRFARGIRPDRAQLATIMVRRLKSELTGWDGAPLFPQRRLEAIEVPYNEEERTIHRQLQTYAGLRARDATGEPERFATEFVMKLLKKRLFSSPAAFAHTLEVHERSIATATRRKALTQKPELHLLRRQIEGIDEEFADDRSYAESTETVMDTASRLFRPLAPVESALLHAMQLWSGKASGQGDTKLRELIRWLRENLQPNGEWGAERVIIFTEYRDTQRWLMEKLSAAGLTQGERVLMLYGGMDVESRERIKAAFQAGPEVSSVRILLATDAASEGVDLQNHCARLIHYEIPWNPNRMEQRNGRIDRHGQRANQVLIYHFVAQGYRREAGADRKPGDLAGDLEFLMRAALKVETIREDLGKVGPVIASQVERAMLGHPVQLDTALAEEEAQPIRSLLRLERELSRRIDNVHLQLQESIRELHLTAQTIEHVVSVGLEVADQPPLRPVAGKPGLYWMPALGGSWSTCAEGLADRHTGAIRPITFDHELARGRDDLVLAHLNHPLVQRCLRVLRAEVWSPESLRRLHRVTARMLPGDAWHDPLVIAHGRIVVLGGDNQRLHEEIISAGGALRHGRFSRLSVGEVREALAAARLQAAPPASSIRLAELWPSYETSLLDSLTARMRDRTAGLQRDLERRAREETRSITAVLTELRGSILKELHQPEVLQLALFKPAELEQLERNIEALQARAARIPEEIVRETETIRRRYADLTPRLFAVAVEYLVPEGL